ncbi:hypothetical protein QBC35DRAFT_452337 [Podospora australis]|uniref:Uncharacterized protein n=1 Tax=Podospora australis TaxID=1536484 RepID=A0AAN7AIL4_9PEZI|nr:hypothetical protein QBC35DRAFT_452337 [Podospora australis]
MSSEQNPPAEPTPSEEPQVAEPTTAPESVTWENTIKNYFIPDDVKCMKKKFDLSNKDDVLDNADIIYTRTKNKSMPKQMKPFTQENPDPKHPLWTDEMCETFKAWADAGGP